MRPVDVSELPGFLDGWQGPILRFINDQWEEGILVERLEDDACGPRWRAFMFSKYLQWDVKTGTYVDLDREEVRDRAVRWLNQRKHLMLAGTCIHCGAIDMLGGRSDLCDKVFSCDWARDIPEALEENIRRVAEGKRPLKRRHVVVRRGPSGEETLHDSFAPPPDSWPLERPAQFYDQEAPH